jgi:hypothetical protein
MKGTDDDPETERSMTCIKKLKPHEFYIWHGRRPLLGQLDIELTERCNNACIHCCINLPEDDVAARNREMDTDFVKDVITQAADLGCMTVRFTGGEPLLREDLTELYEFTRRLGMQVILFTNARLITSELAALLAKMPPGDKLFSCGAGHGTCIDAYGQAQMCMGLRDPATIYDLRNVSVKNQAVNQGCTVALPRPELPDRPETAMHLREFPGDPETTDAEKHTKPLHFALTEYFPRLRELRPTNTDYLRRCAVCFLKGLCEQCPAKSWMENGMLDMPVEYLCSVAHAQARHLGLIADGENAREAADWRERVAQFSGNN